jgi:hypothetical protein
MRIAAPILLLAACSGGAADEGNQIARAEPQPPRPRAEPAGPCVGPIMSDILERCNLGPPERLRGVWVTGFERSEFVPGGTGARAKGDPGPRREWLAFAPGVFPDPAVRAEADAMRTTVAVEIEFEGRRARPPGAVVVVDRIISMRVLGPARQAP